MLIPGNKVIALLKAHGITVKGALHIGAHECEELPFYNTMGIPAEKIVWIDAMQNKVEEATRRRIPNVFQAVVTDKDDADVTFHVTNNVQSSSVLEFGSHAKHHPHVHFVHDLTLKTITIDTFFARNGLDATAYDFWNFDIQGAEMLALLGAEKALKVPKAVYLEVNTEEVYKGCATMDQIDAFLAPLGFRRVETKITEYGWGDALYLRF
jgi:FkbM family methyltransferase